MHHMSDWVSHINTHACTAVTQYDSTQYAHPASLLLFALCSTEQPAMASSGCQPCALGSFTARLGSLCTPCGYDSYSPNISSACYPCTADDQTGLICSGGLAAVKSGYWAYQLPIDTNDPSSTLIYRTTACPIDYCAGALLQPVPTIELNSTQYQLCQYPRLDSPNNWLCAECVQDHIAWGSDCDECTGPNIGLIAAATIIAFVIVLFLLSSGSSTAGRVNITIFFIQIASLETSSVSTAIDRLRWSNPSASSTPSCFAPLTPLQQHLLTFIAPLILIGVLSIVALVQMLLE